MRLLKQLIYGIGFLVVVFLLGWGIKAMFFSVPPSCFDNTQNQGEAGIDCGGPCLSCDVKNAQPIAIHYVKVFKAADGLGVIAEIQNPNATLGATNFVYSIALINALGAAPQTINGSMFIYPGEIKYIIKPYIMQDPAQITQAQVSIPTSTITWVGADRFVKPQIDVQNIVTAMQPTMQVAGRLANQTQYDFPAPIVDAVLYNKNGDILAASQVTLGDLGAFGSQLFTIPFASNLMLYVPPQAPQIPSFPRNVSVGMSGDDVTNLQEVLAEQGLLARSPTGYYDVATVQAVKQLQVQLKVKQTGALDEVTRAALTLFLQAQVPYVPQDTQLGNVDPTRTRVFVEARQ
ncbi:MAG: peptidoglycan-binding domain-containing protein [Candidatus Paceibacterota bacterium]